MKGIFRIAARSMRQNKKDTFSSVLLLVAAACFLTLCLSFSAAMVELETVIEAADRIGRGEDAAAIPAVIYASADFRILCGIFSLFIAMAGAITCLFLFRAFSAQFEKRAKTVSVLATLGADAGQICLFLVAEPLFLSLLSLPCGILLGSLAGQGFLSGLNAGVCLPMGLSPLSLFAGRPYPACALVLLLSLGVTVLSSFLPALRLLRRSPVTVIKTKALISVSLRKTPLDRLLIRLFGPCGRLATAHFENYRHAFRAFAVTLSGAGVFSLLPWMLAAYLRQGGFSSVVSDGILRAFLTFVFSSLALLFLLLLSGVVALLFADFAKRDGDFALLRSLGIGWRQTALILLLELFYHGVYILLATLFFGYIGDLLLFGCLSLSYPYTFFFPAREMLFVAGGIFLLLLALAPFLLYRVRRIHMAATWKKIT